MFSEDVGGDILISPSEMSKRLSSGGGEVSFSTLSSAGFSTFSDDSNDDDDNGDYWYVHFYVNSGGEYVITNEDIQGDDDDDEDDDNGNNGGDPTGEDPPPEEPSPGDGDDDDTDDGDEDDNDDNNDDEDNTERIILDYQQPDLIVSGTGADGFAINLTQETLTIAEGSTISEYSVNGGAKWKRGALNNAQLAKLLNKELNLHLRVRIDGDLQTVTFPKINKRAPAQKLVVNYLIHADNTGATPGDWILSAKNSNVAERENIEVALAAGKVPNADGWGIFYADSGVPVRKLTGSKATKTQYLIRTAPDFDETKGYTAASKPRRINVTSEQKAPNYKVSKGAIKYKANTFIQLSGGTAELKASKGAWETKGEVKLWHSATAKKPASAKQTLTIK